MLCGVSAPGGGDRRSQFAPMRARPNVALEDPRTEETTLKQIPILVVSAWCEGGRILCVRPDDPPHRSAPGRRETCLVNSWRQRESRFPARHRSIPPSASSPTSHDQLGAPATPLPARRRARRADAVGAASAALATRMASPISPITKRHRVPKGLRVDAPAEPNCFEQHGEQRRCDSGEDPSNERGVSERESRNRRSDSRYRIIPGLIMSRIALIIGAHHEAIAVHMRIQGRAKRIASAPMTMRITFADVGH